MSTGISIVEQELWNIFTYYTLHSDPTHPEQLKVGKFMAFAKDCQIISPTLTQAQINLVLTREARNKREKSFNEASAGYITFYDFINLLPLFAKLVSSMLALYCLNHVLTEYFIILFVCILKVYPDAPNDDTAFKQLLLENVLLLAGRRDPKDMKLDPSDDEVCCIVILMMCACFPVF
jgi:hypothetical protein